jgi:hypothetical protein
MQGPVHQYEYCQLFLCNTMQGPVHKYEYCQLLEDFRYQYDVAVALLRSILFFWLYLTLLIYAIFFKSPSYSVVQYEAMFLWLSTISWFLC